MRAGGSSRLVVGTLVLATLVAAALRLPFLGSESWWFDETYTVGVLGAGSLGQLWERIGASESTPPLFYLLAWLWSQLVGDRGEATVRTVSALATIASVPLAYLALRRLAGWRAALGAAAIVAVTPVLTSGYALDGRAYGLLVLCSLLSLWAFGLLLERPSRWRWIAWVAALAAVIWSHWFGGFLVLGEVLALLWLRARRATVLAAFAVGVALLPLIDLLREQTGDERAGFIDGYSIPGRLEQLARQFSMGANVPATWLEAAGLALFAVGVAVGAVLAGRAALASPDPPRDGARALLAVLLIGLLVPLALSLLDLYDRFSIRNVLYLLPLVAALAALGLTRLRAAPLAVYLLVCVTAVVWVRSDWRYQRTDWRAAIELVRAQERADGAAPVVVESPLGQPVAALYLGRTVDMTGALPASDRVTLVVEPHRGSGERGLAPVPSAAEQALAPLFPERRERRVHGFRVIELRAGQPAALDPARLGGGVLYPPP